MADKETAETSAVDGSQTAREPKSRPRGHVMIFGTWCKGCGLCIEFCPQGVFEANGQGRPVVAFADRCTACHWCDTHCPDMAITVRRLEADEVEELEELVELARKGVLSAPGVQGSAPGVQGSTPGVQGSAPGVQESPGEGL
jgi:2-oxoglutarate ferredoxin oxidoreductase subunit delta